MNFNELVLSYNSYNYSFEFVPFLFVFIFQIALINLILFLHIIDKI